MGSSRLQLPLRVAYYGLPSSYTDFDRPMFAADFPSLGYRLDRLVDLQHRWINLQPRNITILKNGDRSEIPTGGLLVKPKMGPDSAARANSADWINQSTDESDESDFKLFYGWIVKDAYGLGDDANPKGWMPSCKFTCDMWFQSLDASREDNVVVVSRTRIVDNVFQVTLRCYLLEPIGDLSWHDGAKINAIPHPEAVPIEFTETFRESTHHHDECHVQLGPGGSLKTDLGHPQSTRQWNWRTGQQMQVSTLVFVAR